MSERIALHITCMIARPEKAGFYLSGIAREFFELFAEVAELATLAYVLASPDNGGEE